MSQEMRSSAPAEIIRRASVEALRAQRGREDVAGFGVVGQPFASGDVLCLRSFPVSTFGPGFASVWHRSPAGDWTVYSTVAPEQSCPRFISAAASRVIETPIEIEWTGPADLTVRIQAAGLRWSMHVVSTPVTWMMNFMMSLMPAAMFRSYLVLSMMSFIATMMLAAGRFRMQGRLPNRQWFQARPRRVWVIADASAAIAGRNLGRPAPLAVQATLGEFPLPQRGVLMLGGVSIEAYAPSRHLPARPATA